MVARRQSATPSQAAVQEVAREVLQTAQHPDIRNAAMSFAGRAGVGDLAREAAALVRAEPPFNQGPTNPLEVGAPLPKSMGRCADLYNDVRQLRLAMDKEVEAVKARESEIREYIISNLSKSADTGAAGLRYRAQIVMKDSPRATDWQALWAYIAKNNRFDLLQKRLGEKAVMDTLADNVRIPGVEVVHVPDVSITKI